MQGIAGPAQVKWHMVTIEDFVPADHFLRKLEAALDLSFVYEQTMQLYSQKGVQA